MGRRNGHRFVAILGVLLVGSVYTGCPTSGGGDSGSPTEIGVYYEPSTEAEPEIGIVTGRYYYRMEEDPVQYFDDFYRLGLHWIRIEFEDFWDHRPGGGTATTYENAIVTEKIEVYRSIIEEAHKRHIKVLGVLGVNSMPGGLFFEDGVLTQNTIDRYVGAVEWHLETYDVDAVEIWNEPWGFGFGSPNRPELLKGYAQLLIESYTSVKPDHPDVLFVAPVTANAEQGEWLGHHGWETATYRFAPEESIFNNSLMQDYRNANGGELPLDVISWHPYGTGGDPAGNFYFGRTFETYYRTIIGEIPLAVPGAPGGQIVFEDIAGRSIVGDYPVWFTEWGWQSGTPDQEETHADYITSMVRTMRDYPQIEVAMLYTYQDDEDTADSEGYRYGIRTDSDRSDGKFRRKEAYFELLGHATRVGLDTDGTIDREFVDVFVQNGGRYKLGLPTSPIQDAPDGTRYQILRDGVDGPAELVRPLGESVRVRYD